MATRIEQFQETQNNFYLQQLAGSLLMAAIAVLSEPDTQPNHENRLAWAKQIMSNPQGQAQQIVNYTMQNATVSGNAGNAPGASGTAYSDSDIDYVVASLYDQFATAAMGG